MRLNRGDGRRLWCLVGMFVTVLIAAACATTTLGTQPGTTVRLPAATSPTQPATPNTPETKSSTGVPCGTLNVNFEPWLRTLISRVRTHWFVPYSASSKKGHNVVTFKVYKDGRITEIALQQKSGVSAFDLSSPFAVKSSQPLPPLPETYRGEFVSFTVTFYYNETVPTSLPEASETQTSDAQITMRCLAPELGTQ